MSDPFSITGSAVGVISLGISVCGGLLDYYRSWKGVDDDASRIYKYIDDVNGILEVLQTILQRDEFGGESRRLVEERIVSCADGIRELDGVWKKFKDVPNAPKAKSRISSYFKRACYPFQEQTLSKIQSNASEIRDNLNLAVGILNADIAADNKQSLTLLQSSLTRTSQDIATISLKLNDHPQDGQTINEKISTIGTDLEHMGSSINSRLDGLPNATAVALRRDLESTSDRLQRQISTLINASVREQQDQIMALMVSLEARCFGLGLIFPSDQS
jgi:hypothetical protein